MNNRTLACILLPIITLFALAQSTIAQMIDTEPAQVRVVADNADLRCGWGSDGWYSVGLAPAGTTLTTDGREGEWLRVSYPDDLGFGVLVRIADVTLDDAAGTATTTRPVRPIHRNRQSPVDGSWMKLTGDPLPPGTTLRVIETLSTSGAPSHVLVQAPASVRAYVLASDVEPTDQAPAATPDQQPDPTPAPETAEESQPESTAPAETQPQSEPADTDQTALPADETVLQRESATPAQLFESYNAIIREPIEDAEIEPLIAEFETLLAQTPTDSEEAPRLASRLDLLQIRLDLQRDLRAVASATERAARERDAIDSLVVDWRSRPTYTVFGRLMASALYDGRRLPLMYRLQSLDGTGRRTIAYILPNPDLDLNAKIGGVVGVVGNARRDRTIRVRLIDPERIDVLEPGQ